MSPEEIQRRVIQPAPLLHTGQAIGEALRVLIESGLPALPVITDDRELAGIFGEREFIAALMPGYLGELKHASFVPASIDDLIEKRDECRSETVAPHMNTEEIAASPGASDVQLAETFLHHRVLIIPIVDNRNVKGVVTRTDFFRELGLKFLASE